ncbi:MerR family transcriptional regulator [Ruminococcaceae bacterium OttesenSCG-928-I18]|nr:MerR family transcriptional regulator [Ruminococcaceae bacterium OttesenSCG-928-I18]
MGRPKKNIRMRLPTGEISRMYSLGMIAEELGRRPKTLRSWYDKYFIPPSGFRDEQGHILYTEEQKNIIVNTAKKYGADYLKCSKIANRYLFKRRLFSAECCGKLNELARKNAAAKDSIENNRHEEKGDE